MAAGVVMREGRGGREVVGRRETSEVGAEIAVGA
jgi:hypothetical protein